MALVDLFMKEHNFMRNRLISVQNVKWELKALNAKCELEKNQCFQFVKKAQIKYC